MMEKMIFGRYVPADSIIHRMDPRSKLLIIFLFVCVVFLANNALTYASYWNLYVFDAWYCQEYLCVFYMVG